MRIGIFGGSFNPPHKMHEEIAFTLISKCLLDKVIFVPTGSNYSYKKYSVSDKDRFNMISLIAKKNDKFMVSDFELRNEEVHTIETLDHFKKEYPNDEIFFICGTDNLDYIDKWVEGERILKEFKILVFKRSMCAIDDILKRLDKFKNNIIVVDLEMNDISSTKIRNDLDKNSPFLDKEVFNYIKNNKLYIKGD